MRAVFSLLVFLFLPSRTISAESIVAVAGGWDYQCGVEGCVRGGSHFSGRKVFRDPNLSFHFGPAFQLGAPPVIGPHAGPTRCLPAGGGALNGCPPGTPISLTTTLMGPFMANPVTVGGVDYRGPSPHGTVFLRGTVEFTARDVEVIPAQFGVFVTPFDVFASLTGYRTDLFSDAPLFSVDVIGQGHLTMTNRRHPFSGLVSTTEFRYTLEPVADPIPEPMTFGLVAAGLAVLARRRPRAAAGNKM